MEQPGQPQNILATEPVGRLIVKFAVPSVVSMLVNALYNIVDQIFIGWGVGYLGNGAVNIVGLIMMVTLALSMLLGDGAAAWYSLRLGEGRPDSAARGFGSAAAMLTAASLAVTGGVFFSLEPVVRAFGASGALVPLALEYGRIVVLGLPFFLIGSGFSAVIRADGSPRYAMASMIAGALVNGCLDPVFIFGFGWGIRGAALSTFIGQLVTFLLAVSYLRRFRCIRVTAGIFRPRLGLLKGICGLGISSLINQVSFTLVMVVNNNLIVHYGMRTAYGGEIPLTAYGLSMKVQEVLYTLVLGVAIGMQPVVGYNCGAKNFARVRRAFVVAAAAATALSAAATVLFVCFPDRIIGLFGVSGDPLFLDFAKRFFRTYFLLYPFFGFLTVSGVFFQAIGRPAQAAVCSLSYQLLFKIGSALLLTSLIGLDGVLWSGPAADLPALLLTGTLVGVQLWRLRASPRRLP